MLWDNTFNNKQTTPNPISLNYKGILTPSFVTSITYIGSTVVQR